MSTDNEQFRQLFIEEAKEHIDSITQSMLTLEKEPTNQEVVNALFRSAHTLKGSSGMMGFKDFQELTHAMEDVFDGMRKGNPPSSDLISVLLECVDALSERLANITNKVDGSINVEEFRGKLQAAQGVKQQVSVEKVPEQAPVLAKPFVFDSNEKAAIRQAETVGERCFVVGLKFSKDCSFKTIRAGMVLSKIEEVAKIIRTEPVDKELEEEKLNGGFKIAVTSRLDEKAIAESAEQVLEVEEVSVTPYSPDVLGGNTMSAPAKASASEFMLSENNYTITVEDKKITKILVDSQSTQTVRVKFDQLDKLMNWVGELVINKIALLQLTGDSRNESLKRITENIDRLTADLQDLVMKVRMVQINQIFDRFPRLVRDLSLSKGKKIELVMEGKEIEIDRTVLDEIGEPLIHLLRNSIDHGIETPEERAKVGKSETGRIVLSAQRSGNHVIVEVKDDGAGIDVDKVRESALRKGLVSKAELDKMNREQLINLIFLPGLSTAKEITETSGRGVGMDVVKTKISALGGSVHIDTEMGVGTRINIKLPITLAIIQAILIKDSSETFAIPTSQVSEVVRITKDEVKSLGKTSAILIRNRAIPIVHLHQLLGLPDSLENELELLIVYLGDENTKLGIVVDSVLRQQDILVKSLSGACAGIKGISGATILGDGQVVLVLDVAQFVSKAFKKAAG